MTLAEVRAAIAGHPFARGMTGEELDAIAEGARLRSIPPRKFVFREGEPADHCYLITDGQIGLELHVPHRGAVTADTAGTGELVGWSWLVPPHVWRFDAVARTEAGVIELDAAVLRAACDLDPRLDRLVSRQLLTMMANRLEASRHQLLDVYGDGNR